MNVLIALFGLRSIWVQGEEVGLLAFAVAYKSEADRSRSFVEGHGERSLVQLI